MPIPWEIKCSYHHPFGNMIAILREGVVKNFIISFGVCRNIYFVLLVLSLVLYVDILVSFLGLTGTFSLNFCFKSFQIFFLTAIINCPIQIKSLLAKPGFYRFG